MAKKTNVPLKRRRRSELNVKLIAIIAAVLFVVTIGIVSAVIGSHKKENNPSVADNQNNETTAEPTTEEETTTKVPTIEVDLMMIGDMLMHEGVVKSGLMDDGTYNFDHLYTNIAKDISSADIRIVNQETILGGSDFAYTGYPTFNSPWALGDAEVKAGFNIILHATNHTLDKGLKGVENCLSFWKTYHPDTTVLGINETEEDYENIYVYEKIGGGAIIGNCSIGSRKLPIYCVDLSKKTNLDTSKKYVSISFDAAWGDEDTIKILDILDKYNIKTTFFMTGGWVDSYPDKVLEIYNRGHDLGNHSQNHKEMSKLSVNEQKDEIMSVANKIKEITGYTSFLFRPPYGDYNSTLIDTVYGCNFYPIEWDVDSLDWKDYGTDNIIKTVTTHKALKNGSIILMHNGAKYTAEALESVITGLQSQGYEIVPISQLINTENFHMDGTGLQIPD